MKIHSSLVSILLFALSLMPWPALAQQFTKVATGAIVGTPSGSRSCNFLDFNNDDFPDILITNGKSGGENNFLYLNNGDGTFSPVSGPISSDGDPTDGATCADFDNDGFIDVFAVNWYGDDNLLYRNSGGASFVKIDTGITANDGGFSETAAWGDYDGDGLVDLYVTNSSGSNLNYLYRNLGAGAFEKVAGIGPVTDSHLSRCANWIDYDRDGDQDLFVTNENNQKNALYRNTGGGNFSKLTGDPIVSDFLSTMTASWADYDNDGDFDLFTANYQQANKLFNNDGNGNFTEVMAPWGTDIGCSFGSSFADMDNDGDLDLFVTNGYCSPNLRNFLYQNNGDGTFTRIMTEPMATDQGSSYGCAWGDYDNDGFMDLVVANWRLETQNNSLYHNNGNGNHWLALKLEGTVSNRSAIGAIVRCKATINGNPVWQMRDVSSQSGYCSQNSLVVHFGLGDAATVDSLEVVWPSGVVQSFGNLGRDNRYSLLENGGITVGLQEAGSPGPRMEVYPNPSAGEFSLALSGLEGKPLQIELTDINGRSVLSQSYLPNSPQARVLISGLPENALGGLYLLSVRGPEGVLMQRRILIRR